MKYKDMTIERLEKLCASLYQEETRANNERREASKVLQLKLKKRDADKKLEESQAVSVELDTAIEKIDVETSWIDKLKEKMGR